MYTLRSPKLADLTNLGRHMSNYLNMRGVDMIDRRKVTAMILGSVAGGALPVDGGNQNARAKVYRDQHTLVVREWLGRLSEAFAIDHELAALFAFMRWDERCRIAYPDLPSVDLMHGEKSDFNEQNSKLFCDLLCKYPLLKEEIPFEVRNILVNRGA